MFHFITKVVLFFSLSIGLYAGNGLSQKHLVSVSPETSASDVSTDISIEIVFDRPVVAKSVKKHTIKLKNKATREKVEGTTALVGESTLVFTPREPLVTGKHKVVVKQVKLQKSDTQQKCEPSTHFERFVYWFCSRFYDEPSECGWCQYVCGNSNIIKTKNIKYKFTVDDNTPQVETIILNQTSVELHEGNETTLIVTANYDDNSSENITSEVEWKINDTNIVSIINGSLKALKEGQTTIEAKYEDKTSEALTITVYKEINGYKLPPEPDPAVNNATLLGIDSNGNGIRDDVERKIIIKYVKPIEIELMLASAKIHQEMLNDPIGSAIEVERKMSRVGDCKMYLRRQNIRVSNFVKSIENITYNTKQRVKAYLDFNKALSGGVYGSSPLDYNAEACDFDVEQMLKDRK